MKYFLAVVCLVLVSHTCYGALEKEPYWVVGSFKSIAAATKEMRRLEFKIGQSIRIATFTQSTQTAYRLLTRYTENAQQKAQFEALGINPWMISIHPRELEFGTPKVTAKLAASLRYYLVLAGFNDKNQAEDYAKNLSQSATESIDVLKASLNNQDYFRVVNGPYDTKMAVVRDQFVLMGMDDAWWLDAPSHPMVDFVAAKKSKHLIEPKPSLLNRNQSRNQYQYNSARSLIRLDPIARAPKSGESYLDYCVKKANPTERERYCADGEFASQLVTKIASMNKVELLRFCSTKATGQQRAQYCQGAGY